MLDVEKYVEHWKDGALEDMKVAQQLVNENHIRHGLFFAHLALEKVLKAHIFRITEDYPPKIHNLPRLAELANIQLNDYQRKVLAEMNRFNIEGRYSDLLEPEPLKEDALYYLKRAKEVYQWLMNQL